MSAPPPAPPDLGIVVLHDWFKESLLVESPERTQHFHQFREHVQAHYPNARTYEFLPLVGIEAPAEELAGLLAHPAVYALIRPRFALDYYEIVLSALNALRSQTGHQMFQFYTHVMQEGGKLPHASWEGGLWPARPGYPRVRPS